MEEHGEAWRSMEEHGRTWRSMENMTFKCTSFAEHDVH